MCDMNKNGMHNFKTSRGGKGIRKLNDANKRQERKGEVVEKAIQIEGVK